MTLWIGIDEAGYGPNLGPLVVCASVWRADRAIELETWPERLAGLIRGAERAVADDVRLVIDDSKRVYQAGKGLAELERSVLALVGLCGGKAADVDALRCWLDATQAKLPANGKLASLCRNGSPARLPTCNGAAAVDLKTLGSAMCAAGVEAVHLAGRIVDPHEFNRRLEENDNKAAVLSETTMELLCGLSERFPEEDVIFLCDKHGGRDRYYALLCHFLPQERIEIVFEGAAQSVYRWAGQGGSREVRFSVKGERYLPTAAASMTAKYVRELCIAEWNAFWLQKIPGLKPTAGYPVDAKRFRDAIAATAAELGLSEAFYWRRK